MPHPLTPHAAEADDSRGAARNQLVLEHVSLVRSLASRLSHRLPLEVERDDLVSVGVVGLIDAAGRYKPSLGVPFGAFARRRVHGAMLDSLRDADWAPRSTRRLRRGVDAAIANLRYELRREPDSDEIAGRLQMSMDRYAKVRERLRGTDARTFQSVDAGIAGGDVPVDPGEGPHARVERLERLRWLKTELASLPPRERRVLVLSYQHDMPLAEIGGLIGLSESRVSQLRTQAIARLRSRLAPTPQESQWPQH